MSFSKETLPAGEWTLISSGADNVTFMNATSWPIYINATDTADEPIETVGLIFDRYSGVTNCPVTDLTMAGGKYIWARPCGPHDGSIVVESAAI